MAACKLRRLVPRLLRGERGTVTIEFILWIPVILVIMAFTADACKLYLTQADMWDVARDTARRMSIGQYCTASDAQTFAESQLIYATLPYTYAITASTSGSPDIVEISTPIASASVFGVLAKFGGFSGGTLDAKITMPAEPGVCS